MLTAVLSPRPHGRPIAPQVSRKGPRRLSSRRVLRPSPASHAVGSSRHSSTPCRRFATAFSSAGNAASETTTGAPPSRASTRSTVPSGRRSHSSAGVLPLDGPPTSACHRMTGSLQASVMRADTPWPHRPATDASSACAM